MNEECLICGAPLEYLQEAVRRNPQEARLVLSGLFPEGMEPKDYIKYMKDKLSL